MPPSPLFMRVCEGAKKGLRYFKISRTYFKKQGTYFLFAPNPSPQRAKTTFRFLTLAAGCFRRAAIIRKGPASLTKPAPKFITKASFTAWRRLFRYTVFFYELLGGFGGSPVAVVAAVLQFLEVQYAVNLVYHCMFRLFNHRICGIVSICA